MDDCSKSGRPLKPDANFFNDYQILPLMPNTLLDEIGGLNSDTSNYSDEGNAEITDISYTSSSILERNETLPPPPEEIELRALLSEWGQEDLAEELIDKINHSSVTSSSGSIRSPTPPREPRFAPYEQPSTSVDHDTPSKIILLATILNESPRGNMLVEYYTKFSIFQEDQRFALITLIAQSFQERQIKMTLAASYQIEKEILERFPSEKLIDMDFKAAFENRDGLLCEWDEKWEKIVSFLMMENHIKDRNVKVILENLNHNTAISESKHVENTDFNYGRNAALVWALHGYLVPTTKIIKKDSATGKKSTTKFTIKGSQESVCRSRLSFGNFLTRSLPLALIRANGTQELVPPALKRAAVKCYCYAGYFSRRETLVTLMTDCVGGCADRGDLSDYEDDDITTQAVNDLPSDSDEENPIDVPTGNAHNKKVIIDWKVDPTNMKSLPFLKTERLLIPPNGNSPIDYFHHIMTDNFLQAVVAETNAVKCYCYAGYFSRRETLGVKKYYTDSELLQILEDSDFDDFDCVGGCADRGDLSDYEDDDITTQAVNDLPSDSDEENPIDVPTGNAHNKKVIIDWKVDPTNMKSLPFLKTERLLIPPNGNSPIDYFHHIMTDNFLQAVVAETNANAEDIFLSRTTKENSRICDWKNLTLDELLVFLGVFLHMGNVKLKRFQDYWKKDPFFHCKAIADNISRNRFLAILRSLHFSKKSETWRT
ncbi:hypothetical protein NQ314_009713 [Rhamnusium bicolor]|uniref:PiggyBac transposable element-derived protein domain-containing protein n=1 Tax=Rhamnusium bicolor TaxID=1586634 RepID=A0AAV8XXZ3_9CUCU|nr:hypothetical protein NQ314_009713 [Rhamnusium bicolor]